RPTAIARTLRALDEMEVGGIATTIPADVAILAADDFANVEHSTKWVEEVLDLSGVEAPTEAAAEDGEEPEPKVKRDVDVEVNGKRFAVSMWVPESQLAAPSGRGGGARRPKRRTSAAGAVAGSGSGNVVVPMQGTVVKIVASEGDEVAAGDTILVLEAMKMENNVVAEKAGTVSEIKVSAGDSVSGGDIVAVIT
ncbi:MAG: biotin/lipoyl-containing protein, partial [Acidimicrobiales bacterium]